MDFTLDEKHLKRYPHFDQLISPAELMSIVEDPTRVATNPFLPFLQYTQKHQPFRDRDARPKQKERLIRYASRRDSFIFSYYRALLSGPYEMLLHEYGISHVPTAYRKIPKDGCASGGKCNIDFAKDVFDEIRKYDNSTVVALDIRKYFESIDHRRLYTSWCELLEVDRLPDDHLAVFKAITNYRYVDRTEAYERLGYIGPKSRANGMVTPGFLVPFKKMPKQLCSPREFRAMIAGKGAGFSNLIRKNQESHGIPQGAPLSDLLANVYLFQFDVEMNEYAASLGGQYRRYSDDLVFVIPGGGSIGDKVEALVSESIQKFGSAVAIKNQKTAIGKFTKNSDGEFDYRHVKGDGNLDGIQYLGFRFDGKRIFLRNSTLSNFYRKITKRARNQARKHVSRFDGHGKHQLTQSFDFHEFEKRFGRVRDFESLANKKGWTFWTYARRAAETFGDLGRPILKQVSGYRVYIRRAVEGEIERQLSGP